MWLFSSDTASTLPEVSTCTYSGGAAKENVFFVLLFVFVSVPSKLTIVMSSASRMARAFSNGKSSPDGSSASCLSNTLVPLLRVSPPMVTSPVAEIVTITEPSSCTRQSLPSSRAYQGSVSNTASAQVSAAGGSPPSNRDRSSISPRPHAGSAASASSSKSAQNPLAFTVCFIAISYSRSLRSSYGLFSSSWNFVRLLFQLTLSAEDESPTVP